MKTRFLTALVIFSSTNVSALPAPIVTQMQHMCAADSQFVKHAIMNEVRKQNPDYDAEIVRNWPSICETPEAKAEKAKANTKTESTEILANTDKKLENSIFSLSGFSGQLEAGLNLQSGNTDATEINFKASGEQDLEDWRHHFEANAYNSIENDIRTDEEYRVGLGTDWKIDDRDYVFGKIDYVNDRFAGFDYRISETVGLGRRWIDDDVFLLDTRIGPGLRQTKFTDGDSENNWIILAGLKSAWVVNEFVEVGEDADVEFATDNTIINSETWAKSKLTDDLSLKAAVEIEHKTEVPIGREKTDTRTTLGVVYDY